MQKVDSTRGNSIMDPRSYKGEINVQVWLDSRKVAMISEWVDKNGAQTRYVSEVVKACVDIVADHLLAGNLIEKIETVQLARDILSLKYKSKFKEKGKRNRLHNLVLDDRRINSLYDITDRKYMEGVSNIKEITSENKGTLSVEDIKEEIRKGKEIEKEEIRRMKEEELSKIQYDEDGLCINNFVEPKQVIPEWARPKAEVKEKEKNIEQAVVSVENHNNEPLVGQFDIEAWKAKKKAQEEEEIKAIDSFDPSACAVEFDE